MSRRDAFARPPFMKKLGRFLGLLLIAVVLAVTLGTLVPRPLWQTAADLGLIVELHIGPNYGHQAAKRIADFPDTPVLIEGISDDFAPGSYDMTLVARPTRDQWILGGPGVGTPLGDTMLGGTP